MAAKFKLEVVTLEKKLLEKEVESVILPTSLGETGIMANHIPMVTALEPGELKFRVGEEFLFYAVSGGFAEIRPDRVLVLADAAEHAEEIDEQKAEEARKKAEETMKRKDLPVEEFEEAAAALRRSIMMLKIAKKRKRRQV